MDPLGFITFALIVLIGGPTGLCFWAQDRARKSTDEKSATSNSEKKESPEKKS